MTTDLYVRCRGLDMREWIAAVAFALRGTRSRAWIALVQAHHAASRSSSHSSMKAENWFQLRIVGVTGLRPWAGAQRPPLREARGLARSAGFTGSNQLETTPRAVRYQDVHCVYVLRSLKDGNLYTGYTGDLRKRVADHHAGKARTTHDRRPLQFVYYEAYLLPKDAKAREVFLKSGSGKRFIRKQLSHYFSMLK